jgi:hypothetical protein
MSLARSGLGLALAFGLAGCVTIDGTLEPSGAARVRMTYHTVPNATEGLERRRFTSPHVTVESFSMAVGGEATVVVRADDAANLSSVPAFRDSTVKRERKDGNEVLTIQLVNQKPLDIADAGKPGPKITLTLPGKIVEANEGATISGNVVTWTYGLAAYVKRPSIDLVVRYASADPAPSSPH